MQSSSPDKELRFDMLLDIRAKCFRRSARPIILCCIVGLWASAGAAQEQHNPLDDVLPRPCASSRLYKDFEKKQIDAYLSDTEFHFRLMLEPSIQDSIASGVLQDLHNRARESGALIRTPRSYEATVAKELKRLKLPTCYENRAVFFMISRFSRDVEVARQELGLKLYTTPHFGSLPSNDINAHTYPAPDGQGAVIALNSQLLNFVYASTRAVVVTVDSAFDSHEPSHSTRRTNGLLNVAYNRDAQDRFFKTLLSLYRGTPLDRPRLSHADEALVMFLAGAMERFVVAHEYGHLVTGHALSRMEQIPIGRSGTKEFAALKPTWEEEFWADETGMRLLTHILLRSADENPEAARYYIYALHAPLFFFGCMDLLEQMQNMETKQGPFILTEDDKSLIRKCSRADNANADACNEYREKHPPAWLREERLRTMLTEAIKHLPKDQRTQSAIWKGEDVLFNLAIFSRSVTPLLEKELTK
jgi:hypothetical protein